ncbi:MAG TPA: SOS response-associated peptidase [Longimicrobiales bacterium]
MCGRFTLAPPEPTLRELIGPADWRIPYTARWNVAPGQDVLAVTEEGGGRVVEAVRWGFPSAAQMLVNARLETAATSGLFRHAWAEGRCIVPADSFYEWEGKGGQPYRVLLGDGRVFGLAAIRSADGGLAVLTTDACDALAPIHHRMPAILSTAGAWRAWLAGGDPAVTVANDAFRVHPVSRRVNSVLNDDPECAEEAPPEPRQMSLFQ